MGHGTVGPQGKDSAAALPSINEDVFLSNQAIWEGIMAWGRCRPGLDAIRTADRIDNAIKREMITYALAAREPLEAENRSLRGVLESALNALRSYQYGNDSTDLAQEVADRISAALQEPTSHAATTGEPNA